MTKHERTVPDIDCIGTLCVCFLEGCCELIRCTRFHYDKFQSQQMPGLGQLLQAQQVHFFCGIDEHGDPRGSWNKVLEELKMLSDHAFGGERCKPGHIPARM